MKELLGYVTEMGVVLEEEVEGDIVGGVSVIGGVHMNLASTRLWTASSEHLTIRRPVDAVPGIWKLEIPTR